MLFGNRKNHWGMAKEVACCLGKLYHQPWGGGPAPQGPGGGTPKGITHKGTIRHADKTLSFLLFFFFFFFLSPGPKKLTFCADGSRAGSGPPTHPAMNTKSEGKVPTLPCKKKNPTFVSWKIQGAPPTEPPK